MSRDLDRALMECAKEPIHTPGAIQPHGFLIAVDANDHRVTHVSENVERYLALSPSECLGATMEEALGKEVAQRVLRSLENTLCEKRPVHVAGDPGSSLTVQDLDLVAHTRNGSIIIEGERVPPEIYLSPLDLQIRMDPVFSRIERSGSTSELCQVISEEIRELTGFDRVLVYKFDADWNGTVIGEDRNDRLPSYLDLRFPAADIPPQARELYRQNRIRLIARSDYEPVKLLAAPAAATRGALDLSLSTLRSVSPVHLEYMRNMGTGSSMSISILRGDELWGLISCHHRDPRVVPFATRASAELLGQMFSLHLALKEQAEAVTYRVELQSRMTNLVARVADKSHLPQAVADEWEAIAALTRGSAVAAYSGEEWFTGGDAPPREFLAQLIEKLEQLGPFDVFATDSVAQWLGEAAQWNGGILAMSISRAPSRHLVWFRPEVTRTVRWGGDPRKEVTTGGDGQLHPRRSFETWKEIVRGRAEPWRKEELDTAREFRNAIIGIVLRRAEELASISEELARRNEELAAFSYSVSHDLRAPFRHIRSYAEILKDEKGECLDEEAHALLDRMLGASAHAGALVDNLLAFSRMGRAALKLQPVHMNSVVASVVDSLDLQTRGRKVRWKIEPLPSVVCDLALIHQVWQNLLENAVKYTRQREVADIEIFAEERDDLVTFTVRDNGAGFDMRYQDKLFGVFQRLHRTEDFEGTGIGLANVKRIVERHGGKVAAEGAVGKGAAFFFTLPKHQSAVVHAEAHSPR